MFAFNGSNGSPWNRFKNHISTVIFNGNVTSIQRYAFYECTNLSSITIPPTVTAIKPHAFKCCKSLSSITIPASVEELAHNSVFVGCTRLSAITVEEGNPVFKDINGVLFVKADSSIVLCPPGKSGDFVVPGYVKTIKSSAFLRCEQLTSVIISDGVSKIEDEGFHLCTRLNKVRISASVRSIGSAPFLSCTSLTSIEVDESNPSFKSVDGVLFNSQGTTIIQYPPGREGGYAIPDTVATIGQSAFQNSTGLTAVLIPGTVGTIHSSAFKACPNLELVSYLGTSDPNAAVFSGCDELHSICVPADYQSNAFCGFSGICKSELCGKLEVIENHCFKATCEDDGLHVVKRSNATEWEKKTNGCVEYKCSNESGPSSQSKCVNSKKNVCVNNECAMDNPKPAGLVAVNITTDPNDEEVLNTTRITEAILSFVQMELDELILEVEMDENGRIINVIVYLDDEKTVQSFVDAVNACKR